jgi:hypothetical protein
MLFDAAREAGYGPNRQFAAVQQNARNWGTTRHSADAAGTAAPDLERKSAGKSYRLGVATAGAAWLSPISATTTPTT